MSRWHRLKFEDLFIPEPNSGCWLWIGSDTGEYGVFWMNGRSMGAHRVAWLIYRGEIPAGLCVLHNCDTPLCVNPDHLWLGTKGDNKSDCVRKGRHAQGERNGGGVKLSDPAIVEVFRLRSIGESQESIGRQVGVSQAVVSAILLRKVWKHVRVPEELRCG